jgi:tRNA A-37 threonylcarbamoyl transferase component Bud32
MKTGKIGDITWFLNDEISVEALGNIRHEKDARRGYFTIDHEGRRFFVKVFSEKGLTGLARQRISPRGKKEYDLGKRLIALSIPTPRPVGYGMSRRESYVIQEWVDGTGFLDLLAAGLGREDLLASLADFLRALAEKGVRHNDLHLQNILVTGETLYLVDLHKMRIKKGLEEDDEVSNLSHALAMIYLEMTGAEREAFFARYGNSRIRDRVEAEIGKMRERWVRSKEKRAFSSSSKTVVKGDRVFMRGRETLTEGRLVQVVKEDRKVRVERFSDHIRKVYRDARRLERAWKAHVVLEYMELAVVPAAFFATKPSTLGGGSIAMEDLKGKGEELDRFLDRDYGPMAVPARRALAGRLASFLSGLIRKGIAHRDLKGCNLFALHDGRFLLLDVEDILFGDVTEERLARMLVQLNTTIPRMITDRDRMRIFLGLTARMGLDRRKLFREVLRRSLAEEIVYEGVDGLKREKW